LDVAGWDPDVDRTPNLAAAVQRVEQVGLDATLARLRTMPRDSLAASGYQIEQVARGLLAHRRTSEAIALMRFNAETLENDPAVQASFARLFEVTGQLDSARVHAGRALALDSLDTRAQEIARRLGAVARCGSRRARRLGRSVGSSWRLLTTRKVGRPAREIVAFRNTWSISRLPNRDATARSSSSG